MQYGQGPAMKILSVGNFTTGWDGSICDEEHIAKALELAGHSVDRRQRESLQSLVAAEYGGDYIDPKDSRPSPDFILIAQWDGYTEGSIKELKLFGCPLVYWAFDYQAEGQGWHELLVSQADLYLSKPWTDSRYPNWHWLPQDFAPSFLGLHITYTPKDIDVLFTGSYLPWATERIEYLRAVDKMFDLTIHSFTPQGWIDAGFKNVQGPVMDKELPALISRAKINLGIDHTITPGYWSDRSAQVMVCGGFMMSKYVPGMELVFRNHMTYFHDIDSMLAGIKYFLDKPIERDTRARWGSQFARANLMVENRVNDLLIIMDNFT